MDDASWSEFVERHFEKAPVVLRGWLRDTGLVTEAELFDLLASLPGQPWPGSEHMLRFYAGKRLVENPFARLPRKADRNFARYVSRMQRTSGEFGVVVDRLTTIAPVQWKRARQFLFPLFAKVGYTPGPTSIEIFLNACPHTPFGVHKDAASIFHAVVRGPKRMLVWPYEALAHLVPEERGDVRDTGCTLRGITAAEIRDRATVLEAETGDIIYWPSTYWHVAEAVPGHRYSLSHNVAVSCRQPRHVFDAVTEALMKRRLVGVPAVRTSIDARGAVTLPPEIAGIAADVRALIETGELEDVLAEGWMEHISASGFVDRPEPQPPVELDASCRVRVDPGCPILWRTTRSGTLVVCANGRTAYLDEDRLLVGKITRLIGLLNDGESRLVRQLVAELGKGADAKAMVLSFLAILRDANALAVEPGSRGERKRRRG